MVTREPFEVYWTLRKAKIWPYETGSFDTNIQLVTDEQAQIGPFAWSATIVV